MKGLNRDRPAQVRVALTGAPRSGKSALLAVLTRHYQERGIPVHITEIQAPSPSELAELAQQTFALTLLMGLDGPLSPEAEQADDHIRQALMRTGTAFRVVHGQGEQQAHQAINAINSVAGYAQLAGEGTEFGRGKNPAKWNCEKCSDPECEHKLLSGLLSQRTAH